MSLYGTGVFQPSCLRLCNYRDSQFNAVDDLLFRIQREHDESVTGRYSLNPHGGGLLPFASCTSDLICLWNTIDTPWSIVCVHENGLSSEELKHLDTLEFLLKCFHLDGSCGLPSEMAAFLRQCSLQSPPQQFESEVHEPRIKPGVCRPVARGGERASYRVAGLLDLTLPGELQLDSAEENSRGPRRFSVRWCWRPPEIAAFLAPTCSFSLFVIPEPICVPPPPEYAESLLNVYFARRARREMGTVDAKDGVAYWVMASETEEGGHQIPACNIAFLGSLASCAWEVWVSVHDQHLDHYFEEAKRTVKSIRVAPDTSRTE